MRHPCGDDDKPQLHAHSPEHFPSGLELLWGAVLRKCVSQSGTIWKVFAFAALRLLHSHTFQNPPIAANNGHVSLVAFHGTSQPEHVLPNKHNFV
jgi:hypothetical protein